MELYGHIESFYHEYPSQVLLITVLALGLFLVILLRRKSDKGNIIPYLQGGYPILGQVFEMVKGSPWDTMTKWSLQFDGIFRFYLFGSSPVCVTDPELIKIIFSIKLRTFQKDVEWAYKPFLVQLPYTHTLDYLIQSLFPPRFIW